MIDNDRVQVLEIPYTPIPLLINRFQCDSSVYINRTKPRSEPIPWISEELVTQTGTIPLIHLDQVFQTLFLVENTGASHLAILRNMHSFPLNVQSRFMELGIEATTPLGFRIPSGTKMVNYSVRDFSLLPRVLAPFANQRGLLGAVLPGDGGMKFLIDMDLLLLAGILEDLHERTDS